MTTTTLGEATGGEAPQDRSHAEANRLILVQVRMAVACLLIAILGGMVGALHYVPSLSPALAEAGISLQKLRPIHTTFASVWIFGAAIAVMYHYLSRHHGGLTAGDRSRFWFHTACWMLSGIAILVTIGMGVFSGREYIGFHPAISVVMLTGWGALAYSFLRRLRHGFWDQPIYIWFWTVGLLFFMYTFAEGHAYLLPWVEQSPIRDLQIQWKSCGTLVGSFNFMMYGALVYVSERLSGDKTYGQSPVAFWLFGVGCLNSFTNYAHHTYHLPQNETIKWVAFIVSMIEIVILLKIMSDLGKSVRNGVSHSCMASRYLGAAKWWTGVMLFSSVLISIPPLNSVIHGTHAVTGHAMGTELGIDTMVLFGAVAFLLVELRGVGVEQRLGCERMKAHLIVMNVAMILLVGWLHAAGTAHGYYRMNSEAAPDWVQLGRYVFPLTGGILGVSLLYLVFRWLPLLRGSGETEQRGLATD